MPAWRSPHLALDTEGTIAAGKRLFATVDRPNLMIKVPGTPEGVPVEALIASGINVNVTLLFAVPAYEAAARLHPRLGSAGSRRWRRKPGRFSGQLLRQPDRRLRRQAHRGRYRSIR